MDVVKQVKERFLENKQKVLEGKLVGLPIYESFPRLGQFIPVIPPAIQIMFTANSGVGKSNSWIGIILLTVYKLKKKHPDKEFKFRFLISLLEDSKEDFIAKLYAALILLKHHERTDILELNSRRGNPLSQKIESKLDDVEAEINELLSYCEIVDSISNPTGLYKWGRAISNKLGTHYTKELDFVNDRGETYKQEVYSHYVANDPDEQVIWIVDNLNNLQQEMHEGRLLTERETINRWTRQYGRLQITKHWKWTLVNIMQQSAESEKPQFDFKGNLIIERCKPSLKYVWKLKYFSYFCKKSIMGKVKWTKYVDDYLKLKEKGYGCNVIARELGITKSLSKKLRHVTNSEISDKYLYKKYSNQDISNLISCIIGDGGLFIPKYSNSNCYGKISHIGVNYDYLLYKYNIIKDFSNKTHRGRKACKRKVNNKIINCKEEFVINIKASPYNKLIYDLIYVDGKKAITKKSLEYFNDMTLAMLYFDDGSYTKSSNTYRIAMGNMEVQYIELFQNWLKDKYNINTTRYNTYGYYSIYIRRDSHNNLENVLKQYLVPSMEYKIKGEVKSDKLLETPEEDNQQPSL